MLGMWEIQTEKYKNMDMDLAPDNSLLGSYSIFLKYVLNTVYNQNSKI